MKISYIARNVARRSFSTIRHRDLEDAADGLLRNYTGGTPSDGDVLTLKTKIKDALVSMGVSEGILK